jgi:hypothetical protein
MLQIFKRLKKGWYKSKTIWFALLHGLPGLALAIMQKLQIVDLTPILGPDAAAAAAIYLMIATMILRAITNTALEDK